MALIVTLSATSCASDRTADDQGGTLVLAQPILPFYTLDPALEGHVVQFVIASQMFETLVRVKPGGTDIVPSLARSWEPNADGRSWTFRLQPGVTFHDGTPFNAQAVCANFERWNGFMGIAQQLARFWSLYLGGLYRSCEAPSELEVTIGLTRSSGTFISSLAVPAFSMASPDALRRFDADKVSGTDQPRFEGTYGTEHPTGTGPFRFESWTRGDKVVLVRNERYWGAKPQLDRIVVRHIEDGSARRQALQSGELHGVIPVDPGDLDPLRKAGFQVFEQQGLNVGHLALNSARPPLDNLKIRQAIAHAIDVPKLVRAKYPPSATVAEQFLPPGLSGRSRDPARYPYDPARARQLIAESGAADLSLEFWYPTALLGPALPDAESIFLAFKADLEAVGFTVVGQPVASVPEYEASLRAGSGELSLDNMYAFTVDPESLLGLFAMRKQWYGFTDPEFFALLEQAQAEIDQSKREPLYARASAIIMDQLPVIPLAHVNPAIALSKTVHGYVPGPIPWEGLTALGLR